MRGKFRLIVMTLLDITAIYPVVLYMNIRRYDAWKQAYLESLPPDVRPWIDFAPYWATPGGMQLFFIGGILFIFWLLSAMVRIVKVA